MDAIRESMVPALYSAIYKAEGYKESAVDKLLRVNRINKSLLEDVFVSVYGGFKREIPRRDRNGSMSKRILKKYILPIREQFTWFYQYRHHDPEKSERYLKNKDLLDKIDNWVNDIEYFHPGKEAIKDYIRLKAFYNLALSRAYLDYDAPVNDDAILAGVKLLLREERELHNKGFECECGTLDVYPNANGFYCYQCHGALIRRVDNEKKAYLGAFREEGSDSGKVERIASEYKKSSRGLWSILGLGK